MKTFILQVMAICAISLTANAQLQMGTQVSSLTGHGNNDNHTTLVGAVVLAKVALIGNISIGSAIHIYSPKKTKYSNGKVSYSATDKVTSIAATTDMMLGAKGSPFQPYVGMDMGISTSNHDIEYVNAIKKTQKYAIKEMFVMVSPKIGVNIALGSSFGIFSQVQYNYSPGDGGKTTINLYDGKNAYALTTEPISKYINIDAGIYMQLSNMKKIF
ncbi:MAG: hypothetical protein ABIN89_25740 [Chitinophagaceae bacterium]